MLDDRGIDFFPALFERRISVVGHCEKTIEIINHFNGSSGMGEGRPGRPGTFLRSAFKWYWTG